MCMRCVRAENRARETRQALDAQYARVRAAIRAAADQYAEECA
ncbi:hypothetical protein [Cellulosimicrobium cellulans]|nr:hypothetical protein [Cellulosimicrobium cellulans]